MHGRIVDHELVRVWLVSILLGGDVIFFFRSVVGMGMHVPYFIHLRPVLDTILFLYPTAFAIILLHHTYLSYHIACCISSPISCHYVRLTTNYLDSNKKRSF